MTQKRAQNFVIAGTVLAIAIVLFVGSVVVFNESWHRDYMFYRGFLLLIGGIICTGIGVSFFLKARAID